MEEATEQVSEVSRAANTEKVERARQVDEKDDDLFEPEEQSGNDILEGENNIPLKSAFKDNNFMQKDDVGNSLSDAVPVENWIHTTFPNSAIKFAVRFRFHLEGIYNSLTSLRYSNE